jgi:hypothetical protein
MFEGTTIPEWNQWCETLYDTARIDPAEVVVVHRAEFSAEILGEPSKGVTADAISSIVNPVTHTAVRIVDP